MLVRLLSLISHSEMVVSTSEIARQLGTGEGLLLRMIEDATRMGYLATVADGCAVNGCSACGTRSTCSSRGGSGAWLLTEKGRRVLAERTPQS